jgi:hypothetical protein
MTRRDQVSMDDPEVMPRREVRLRPGAAREELSTGAGVEHGQPVADGGAGLLHYGLCLIRRRRRTVL